MSDNQLLIEALALVAKGPAGLLERQVRHIAGKEQGNPDQHLVRSLVSLNAQEERAEALLNALIKRFKAKKIRNERVDLSAEQIIEPRYLPLSGIVSVSQINQALRAHIRQREENLDSMKRRYADLMNLWNRLETQKLEWPWKN